MRAGWTAKHLQLLIEDNGRGFDVDGITAGNGLANLRHRSKVLGGELKITNGTGSGTRVVLNTPLS